MGLKNRSYYAKMGLKYMYRSNYAEMGLKYRSNYAKMRLKHRRTMLKHYIAILCSINESKDKWLRFFFCVLYYFISYITSYVPIITLLFSEY